jgi:hypothetical protein
VIVLAFGFIAWVVTAFPVAKAVHLQFPRTFAFLMTEETILALTDHRLSLENESDYKSEYCCQKASGSA